MIKSKLYLAVATVSLILVPQLPSHKAVAKSPPVNAQGQVESFADLSERLLPSVVNVATTQKMDMVENIWIVTKARPMMRQAHLVLVSLLMRKRAMSSQIIT